MLSHAAEQEKIKGGGKGINGGKGMKRTKEKKKIGKEEKKRKEEEKGGRNGKKGLRWDLNPGPTEYGALVRRGEQWSVLISSWLVPTTTDQHGQNFRDP